MGKDAFKAEAAKHVDGDEEHTFTALHPLPDAGKGGAKTVEVPKVRSEEEIKRDAEKAEEEWMAKKKLAEPEEKEVDDVIEGVSPHPDEYSDEYSDEASPAPSPTGKSSKGKGKIIPKIKKAAVKGKGKI